MTNTNLAESQLRRSRRNQGLPPDFPPVTEENPMESIDQGATTTPHEEENIVVESGDQFNSYMNPLAQQTPIGDTPWSCGRSC